MAEPSKQLAHARQSVAMAESALVREEMNITRRLLAGLSVVREERYLDGMRQRPDSFRERLAVLEALYSES